MSISFSDYLANKEPPTEEEVERFNTARQEQSRVRTPEQTFDANRAAARAAQIDPDEYAVARDDGRRYNLDPMAFIQDKELKRKIEDADVETEGLEGEAEFPELQGFLEDPDAAIVTTGDIRRLLALRKELTQKWYEADFGETTANLGAGWWKTWKHTPEATQLMLEETAFNPIDPYTRDTLIPQLHAQGRHQEIADIMVRAHDITSKREEKIKVLREAVEKGQKEREALEPEGLTIMEQGIRSGLFTGLDMATFLAVQAASGGRIRVMLPAISGRTLVEGYAEGSMKGLSPTDSLIYGGIDGFIEYITERMPTKYLEKAVGALGKGGFAANMKKFLAGELPYEQVATFGQSLNAMRAGLDEEMAAAKTNWERLAIQGRRQAITAIATVTGGGTVAGTLGGMEYLATRKQKAKQEVVKNALERQASESDQIQIDKVIYLAQESKTNKRAADLFQQFVDAHPDKELYIDADAVRAMPNPPAYLTDQLNDNSEGDVAISMGQFLSDIATNEEQLEAIRPYLKTSEKLKTQAELDSGEDSEYIQQILEQANQAVETKAEADQIYEQVRDQIIGTGRQREAEARQGAAIIPALITTQYEALRNAGITNPDGTDITVSQLYEDMGLKVVGPEADPSLVAQNFMEQSDRKEMDVATAKGLAMDKVSRETRAREMGFDVETPYYIGSPTDRGGEFTIDDMGMQRKKYPSMPGVYMTRMPAAAFLYTASKPHEGAETAPNITPVYARMNNVLDLTEIGSLSEPAAFYEFLRDKGIKTRKQGARFVSEFGKTYVPRVYEYLDEGGDTLRRQIIAAGYDGVVFDEPATGQTTVVLEPKNVRGVNAAFDPDFSETPRVLAQQNFGNIQLTETAVDEAGNVVEISESAEVIWNRQQDRLATLDKLKDCINA